LKPGFTANDLAGALNLEVINFASGSDQIPPDSERVLNQAALAIKKAPSGTVLEVAGHTDSTGDNALNETLSRQRAESVRGYLVNQGVDPNDLVAAGYGSAKPIATNDTEEGRFHNRRIEFTVMK
jgi:OOP family OmpA-OmpF porin